MEAVVHTTNRVRPHKRASDATAELRQHQHRFDEVPTIPDKVLAESHIAGE